MVLLIPMALPSVANLREHWRVKAKRVKAQRDAVRTVWGARARTTGPWLVTLTRISPRKIDAHDNLPMSCKALVDQIAEELGVDDREESRIQFRYAQEKGAPAVRIEITSSVPACQAEPGGVAVAGAADGEPAFPRIVSPHDEGGAD